MFVVPLNIGPPSTLTFRFLSPLIGPDLTTTSAVNLNVVRRDGSTATWACTIVSATQSELVAQYTFTGLELNTTGAYQLQPLLTVPGGLVPSKGMTLFVTSVAASQARTEESAWLVATSQVPSPGPVKNGWGTVATGTYAASALAPWIPVDLSGGSAAIQLWDALDGETVVIADYKHNAATHNLTVSSAYADIPAGDGTFASSATFATNGIVLRWKYNLALGAWLEW